MTCFCDSCSSISGIGAPFLYLWCMAGVMNSQLMQKFDEVNKRIEAQNETLKSIQSTLVELTSALKTLVKTEDKKILNSCEKMSRLQIKSDGCWRKKTNFGPQSDWKPKTKVVIDECFGNQNDDSSVGGKINPQKMSTSTPKPNLNSHLQEESQFDICPKMPKNVIQIKSPLHLKNREKRIQNMRNAQGPNINILRPGMVLMKGYISPNDQVKIVKTCREVGIGEGGFYQPGYIDGGKLHLKMMCLGRNWDPQSSRYVDARPIDNSKPPKIPDYFYDMVKQAIQDSNSHIQKNKGKFIPSMLPDICIVNFYTKGGKLGFHQDKDESRESLDRGLPVVSFSVGDTAEFLYGDERDIEKAEKVNLESGDVLIFGGESRHVFHGVPSILPDTAPKSLLEATDMRPGRLNLTFKQY